MKSVANEKGEKKNLRTRVFGQICPYCVKRFKRGDDRKYRVIKLPLFSYRLLAKS